MSLHYGTNATACAHGVSLGEPCDLCNPPEPCPSYREIYPGALGPVPHKWVTRYANVTRKPWSSCQYCWKPETPEDEAIRRAGWDALRARVKTT